MGARVYSRPITISIKNDNVNKQGPLLSLKFIPGKSFSMQPKKDRSGISGEYQGAPCSNERL